MVDTVAMADLSDMLGDVYGDDANGEPARPAAEAASGAQPAPKAPSAAPAWADESVLDAAFANWTPGPPLDAPAAERDVFATHVDPASAAPLPDDLAAALSAALVGAPAGDVSVIASPAPSSAGIDVDHALPGSPGGSEDTSPGGGGSWAELAAARRAHADYDDPFADSMPLGARLPWQRGDDDILPRRSSSSRRGRGGLSLRRK
jgi:hypothetical protein